jgi:hypothetical protein
MTARSLEGLKQRYMHTAFVLFEGAPRRSTLAEALDGLGQWSCETPASDKAGWLRQGPALSTTTRDGIVIVVDTVDRPYPDSNDPYGGDPDTLGAIASGEFGDHTMAGALKRAAAHADLLPDAYRVVGTHRAFVRIRTSKLGPDGHFLGEAAPRSVLVRSMALATNIGARLVRLPGALAWFAPGGEVLASPSTLGVLDGREDWIDRPPIEVWLGVRRTADHLGGILAVETVGAGQLGLDDMAFRAELSPATWLTARVDTYDVIFDEIVAVPPRDGNVVPLRTRPSGMRHMHSTAG